ncbi:Ribosomal RNA large subunit methyltransferase E [Candidatus Johnevansia muelleri]|uniref:Ribosomal RNA large subunit methyltransferase E n=1 Tax=Candidatus Johnevansia muelleri TaxID=1495769 RepID=A0A078KHZ7_9GAMM|nr:Ribosomal RNA large subunit methyltransferase E [Candidatus Evansia muelleri]
MDLKNHLKDIFVLRSKIDNYRSRASYKLLEICKKYKILKNVMLIIDLGSYPGGWSQILKKYLGSNSTIIALDIKQMESLPGVKFIKGDINNFKIHKKIFLYLNGKKVDLIISDMSPNISGHNIIDQSLMINLFNSALKLNKKILKINGNFIIKVFQGYNFKNYINNLKNYFKLVKIFKPYASKTFSKEIYLICLGFYK